MYNKSAQGVWRHEHDEEDDDDVKHFMCEPRGSGAEWDVEANKVNSWTSSRLSKGVEN